MQSIKSAIWAIITARGGSKGLPRKNVRELLGKPLIAYSIEAARQCPLINRTIVSTDDQEIKQVSLAYGAEVIDRPEQFSQDDSSSQDAVRHAVISLSKTFPAPDFIVLLQPTSPCRTGKHITECLNTFVAGTYNSAISVCEADHHPYKMFTIDSHALNPLFNIDSLHLPRQKLPPVYRQNGAIYVVRIPLFLQKDTFFIPPVMPYIMHSFDSIDIDTGHDLAMAALILQQKQ